MKFHLPVVERPADPNAFVDDLRVATPCAADWQQMAGDDRVRHCGDCRLNVYNVSEMTRAEAATLIRAHEGKRVCLRLYKRADGTLITQDCWSRLRAARRRGWAAFAAALVIVVLTQVGLRLAALGWFIEWSGQRRVAPVTAPMRPAPSVAAPVVATPPVKTPIRIEIMGEMAMPPPPPPAPKSKKQKGEKPASVTMGF